MNQRKERWFMLSFDLHLKHPNDFFVFNPEGYDPFDPHSMGESGIDYVLARLRGWRFRVPPSRIVVHVPRETFSAELENKTRAGLRRYCKSRLDETQRERSEFFSNNAVFGVIAIVIVLVGLAIQTRIGRIPSASGTTEVRSALSLGIDVLAWVALWTPVSAFVLDWYPFFRKSRVYRGLMDMELQVKPDAA